MFFFAVRAIVFALWTGFMSVLAIPAALISPGRWVPWVGQRWGRGALALMGVSLEVEGGEHLGNDAYVIMANHTSHFDVICLWAALERPIRMVAKRELTLIPVFGWALALGAAIVIDRGNREKAVRSMARARRAIDKGHSVLLFPEGTRTPPGALGALKKGPFHLALGARADVLPIGLSGTGEILAKGDWRIRRGSVRLRLGTPISTAGYEDSDEGRAALADDVTRALTELMRETPQAAETSPAGPRP